MVEVSSSAKDIKDLEHDTADLLPSVELQEVALTLARFILDTHIMLSKKASKALLKCQKTITVYKTLSINKMTI